MSFKSIEYSGQSNGMESAGSMGWYEQPEELFGIRNRLLPVVLEPGQTADLPLVQIGVLTRVDNLKMWLTDFEEKRHYFEQRDIENVRRQINKYLESQNG